MTTNAPERWFFKHAGQKTGPFAVDRLRELVLSGDLLPSDLVWREGLAEWVPASDAKDLAIREIIALSKDSTPAWRHRPWLLVGGGVLIALVMMSLWMTNARSRFRYESVSGSVTYADGTALPIDAMQIRFHSLARPRDAFVAPPLGVGTVGRATGTFPSVTSRYSGDGILTGMHKVTLHTADGEPLPQSIAHADYAEINRTVLRVDTRNQPFTIVVEQP